MRKPVIFAAVLAVAAIGLLAVPALAQDPAAQPAAAAGGASKSVFEIYVTGGGFIGYLIILLSVAMVALIIEFFVSLQRDKLVPPELIVEIEQLIEEEQYEEALSLCEASRNYLTNTVGAALERAGEGFDAMETAMSNAIEAENMKLLQKVGWLNLVGAVGPMMGLFGTVQGMVSAFTQIAYVANPTPQDLAKGIYTALVTTVWGLIVAIPSLAFYFIFRARVSRLSFEMAGIAGELLDRLKPSEGGK